MVEVCQGTSPVAFTLKPVQLRPRRPFLSDEFAGAWVLQQSIPSEKAFAKAQLFAAAGRLAFVSAPNPTPPARAILIVMAVCQSAGAPPKE